eukprot:scaffold114891_cov22-Attheya_sp.AAC.1
MVAFCWNGSLLSLVPLRIFVATDIVVFIPLDYEFVAVDRSWAGVRVWSTPTAGVLLGSGERAEGYVRRGIFYLEKSGC